MKTYLPNYDERKTQRCLISRVAQITSETHWSNQLARAAHTIATIATIATIYSCMHRPCRFIASERRLNTV